MFQTLKICKSLQFKSMDDDDDDDDDDQLQGKMHAVVRTGSLVGSPSLTHASIKRLPIWQTRFRSK
jgi:hypothetical protein